MQKKRVFVLIIMFIISIFLIEPVYAESCNGLLTPGAYELLQGALNIVRIAAPILLIVLASMDLGIAVVSDDKDALKKSTSKILKRVIAAIAIFFVPLFVNLLIGLIESSTGVNIVDDPMCSVR